jgi:hypothetical protein
VQFDSPNRRTPYTRQASIGYERQLSATMAASVDYIRNDLRDLYLRTDLNPGLRDTTSRTATLRRVDAANFTSSVLEINNQGWANSNSFQFSFVKRQSRGYSFRVAYTYSNTFGNTASPGVIETISTQVLDQLNLDQNEARTSQDRPHVLSVNGSLEVPRTRGLVVSGGLSYQSGSPFTLTDSSTDPNRNGFFEEPLPAGTYGGAAGDPNAITVNNIGGMRGARGPDSFLLNLRGGYRFKLAGGHSLQAHIDVFNVTDRANFNIPGSDRRNAATFLILSSTVNPTRTAQFNLKYTF